MNRLDNALKYAAMGFKMFPAFWTGKKHIGYIPWGTGSSNDPEQLKAWDEKFNDQMYFCVHAKASNITILDIDNKKGKNGNEALSILTLLYGPVPETLRLSTPSGGEHYYFENNCAFSVSKLGDGIDTPVMAPIPGSHVPGKGDYTITHEVKALAPTPTWIIDIVGKAKEKSADRNPAVEPDLPHHIEEAMDYLLNEAPASIQWDRGDINAYNVACVMWDKALTEETAFDLMWKFWNDRCEPPWSAEEIMTKIQNAYSYARSKSGENLPEAQFDPIEPEERKDEKEERKIFHLLTLDEVYERGLKPVNWIIEGFIEAGSLGYTFGQEGAFKSFITTVAMAACVATGTDWYGHKVKQAPVVIIAGEGHRGLANRFRAWEKVNGVSLKGAPIGVSEQSTQFLDDKNYKAVMEEIRRVAQEVGPPGLVIIDTLIRNIGGNQNATEDMSKFLTRADLMVKGGATHIVHHSGHNNPGRSMGSRSLQQMVDAYWKIQRIGPVSNLSPVEMRCLKMKDADPSPNMIFQPEKVVLGEDEKGNLYDSLTMKYLGGEVSAELLAGPDEGMADEVCNLLTEEGQTMAQVEERTGLSRRRLDEIIDRLKDQGLTNVGSNKYPMWVMEGNQEC